MTTGGEAINAEQKRDAAARAREIGPRAVAAQLGVLERDVREWMARRPGGPRTSSPPSGLTAAERKAISEHDLTALIRLDKPEWKAGDRIVLHWARPQKSVTEDGSVISPNPTPTLAIVFEEPVRRAKGGWSISFQVEDRRVRRRFARRKPPARDLDAMRDDQRTDPTPAEIEKARVESNYTTDIRQAVDTLEAVGDAELEEYTAEAWERFARDRPPLERRLAAVREEARRKGIDMSRLDASIERRIQAYEKRLRQAA